MRNYFTKVTLLTLSLFLMTNFSFAQSKDYPTPREEKLLNGLKVLIWSQPKTGRVSVKLRIHSGSAFDPQDKEGAIALLSDILFPDEATKNYFEDELEGTFEVISDYDYIQINATAKSDEFLTILQTIAPAISDPQIDKETLGKVKQKRLEMLKELEQNPGYVADQAVAKRLFGDFPYGRPQTGTAESLAKIDFADLIFARQRILNADNATLAISGDVQSSYAYRVARRLLGGWQKSQKKIPANFRLPEEPDKNLSIIPTTAENVSELRFASKAVARNDGAYFANLMLAKVLENRMAANAKSSVNLESSLLPGYVVYNFSDWNIKTVKIIGNTIPLPGNMDFEVSSLLSNKINDAEFSKAKTAVIDEFEKKSLADLYFDVVTYKLKSVKDEMKNLQKVTLADVNQVADEWKKETLVKVLVVSKVEETLKQDSDPKDPNK